MLNFETDCLSTSERRALTLVRDRGAAVAQGAKPCGGKNTCGNSCIRRAATALMALLALNGRRMVTLFNTSSPKITPDEMSLLCLIAAAQQKEDHLVSALALWLAPDSHAEPLKEAAFVLGEILAKDGNVLPLRFMAPPSRRLDSIGLFALRRPAIQANIALPRSPHS